MARLLLVDGLAYAYRAFHAIRELRSPGGVPTNALFGFIKMVSRLHASGGWSHGAVVWDGGLAAERVTAWPAYKAQRPPMPEPLAAQLEGMVQWLGAWGMASVREAGEADDGIAALATRAAAAGWTVVIASSDKDFMQLVTDRIGLVNPNEKTERVWGVAEVKEKTGVLPEQVVDWLSLVGDAVDNIPGVPGVGPKTAAGLLGEFGSVDGLYARLGEVRSARVREALAAAEGAVRRNVELVRLRTEAGAGFAPEAMAWRKADGERLDALYAGWGFQSLRAGLRPATAEKTAAEPAQGSLW